MKKNHGLSTRPKTAHSRTNQGQRGNRYGREKKKKRIKNGVKSEDFQRISQLQERIPTSFCNLEWIAVKGMASRLGRLPHCKPQDCLSGPHWGESPGTIPSAFNDPIKT